MTSHLLQHQYEIGNLARHDVLETQRNQKALLLVFDYQMLRVVKSKLLERCSSVLGLTRGEFGLMKSDSSLSEVWSAGSRYFGIWRNSVGMYDLHFRYGPESLQKGQVRRHVRGIAGMDKIDIILSIENGLEGGGFG
jgi:hypothetical protein